MDYFDYILIGILVTISLILLIKSYSGYKDNKVKKRKAKEEKYILNVIKVHEDGGVSSHWHGWSSKWLFTYEEAIERKKQIEHLYDEVQILEHYAERKEVKEEVKRALENSK